MFKNEIELDSVRVSFLFKTLEGTVQKNVFRYKTDPADQRRLLYQVSFKQIQVYKPFLKGSKKRGGKTIFPKMLDTFWWKILEIN